VIKPGPGDKKFYLHVTQDEADELVFHAFDLVECFGLDRRISKYKGKRPLGLYRWDIEALYEVYSSILENDPDHDYADKQSDEYRAMRSLVDKLRKLYNEAFKD